MNKYKPVPPHKFPKGVSGNPSGRPKLPPHLAKIVLYGRGEINAIFSRYLRMTLPELEAVIADINTPMMDKWICKSISEGYKNGDLSAMNSMLDRMFGRMPTLKLDDERPITDGPLGTAPQVVIMLPSNGKEAKIIDTQITKEKDE